MTPEESVIYGWCRVIVDARHGRLSDEQMQAVEGRLVIQKEYLDLAMAAIKESRK